MFKKNIIIFSHGFWVRKDSRWFLSDVAEQLSNDETKTILFDYNNYNEETKELLVTSFSEQTKVLQQTIDQTHATYPEAKIVLIAHSQGCIIPCLCNTEIISQIILLAPFFNNDKEHVIAYQTKYPTNTYSETGLSYRWRTDGTTTVIPPDYRTERFATDNIALYNKLALHHEVHIIYPLQDNFLEFHDYRLVKNIPITNLDGDHSFHGESRHHLITQLKRIIAA